MPEPTFQLYNTMTRAVEPLVPLNLPKVTFYVCGPTIYDYAHIGNFRTYVAVDLLRRALKHFGYQIDHVMQFTDVDDKTIKGARAKNLPLKEYTTVFGKAFLEDAKTLNIEIPERTPNATDHIPEMVALIKKLIDKKAAYVSDDGSVYFRIASFPKYGCLCHLDLAGMISGARVNQDEYEKEGVGDFVLWKKWVEADGDVGWDSPWGKGRPGWHIECSALSMEHLGPQIDIHGGGVDLRFPHHENEIAQSEAATGLPFVRHWFHVEHLLVDGQKMSKSLHNMYTLRDVQARGYTGRELRYALISGAAYAKNLNFTWQGMEDAKTALARIDEWRKALNGASLDGESPESTEVAVQFRKQVDLIDEHLANDLNINGVLGQLFQIIRTTNGAIASKQITPAAVASTLKFWEVLDSILGLGDATITIPPEVRKLIEDRAAARTAKDFPKSDELRKTIESLGWKVKDTPKGQEVTKG